jgi:hypothetical protein
VQLEMLIGLHPLALFSIFASAGLIWGLQSAVGANLGHRRDLNWQTGYLLGLLLGGLLFSALYSIRPITQTGKIEVPKWVKTLSVWPSAVLSLAVLAVTLLMEMLSARAPMYVVVMQWEIFTWTGNLLALLGLISFTILGGYLGKRWYDPRAPRPERAEVSSAVDAID